jgi:hypothetical protein
MARDLISLIQASNFGGTAGQSFRNHVTGAIDGTRMSHYLIPSISVDSGPNPSTAYPKSQSLSVSFTLGNFGESASAILRRTISAWSLQMLPISGTTSGLEYRLVSGGAGPGDGLGGPGGGAIAFEVSGAQVGTATYSGSCRFNANSVTATDPERIRFNAFVTTTNPGGAYSVAEFIPSFAPDLGGFNYTLYPTGSGPNGGFPVSSSQRPLDLSNFNVEWHGNSSYSGTPSGSSTQYVTGFISDPGETHTIWLRARLTTTGSWTNYGSISFFDYR